jgi:ribosome-binding ATPase YchF (GTP1/OBG family)
MRVGLAGFAGGGKSTLFELLTGAKPDPGKVHGGQVGIATLSDPRLDFLEAMHKPKKVTPATVELLDTPGLLPGTHGDNPQRLALIREGDALLIVLGAYAGGDPAADLAAFRDEILFADLGIVANRAERLEASVKKPRPDREQQLKELEVVKRVQAALDAGQPIASLDLSDEEKKPMRSFGLLTDKPEVVVANITQGQTLPRALLAVAPDALAIDAKLELELSQLDAEERASFMADLGITELGRDRIIRRASSGPK